MTVLVSSEFSNRLEELLSEARSSVVIYSAFIKGNALNSLLVSLGNRVNVQVIARWQKRDIIFGASDLAVFKICKQKGWSFGISQKLHGKLYIIDSSSILLGSANLTGKGLGLTPHPNIEFGVEIPANSVDIIKLDIIISISLLLLFDIIKLKCHYFDFIDNIMD